MTTKAKRIEEAVRLAVHGDSAIEVRRETRSVEVLSYLTAADGAGWEIDVSIDCEKAEDGIPAAVLSRADASGYYHEVRDIAEHPAEVTARAREIEGMLDGAGVALASLPDREAGWVNAMHDMVRARDEGDDEAAERALEALRAIAVAYHPGLGDGPPAPAMTR